MFRIKRKQLRSWKQEYWTMLTEVKELKNFESHVVGNSCQAVES